MLGKGGGSKERAMDEELQPHLLENVAGIEEAAEKREREVGKGAYGVVFEVKMRGVRCIGKKLHEAFVNKEKVGAVERESVADKFRKECIILSKLRHPNIVQFVGVHQGRKGLTLIMEKLSSDLEDFLTTHPNIPLSLKISLLLDVSFGLVYLHEHSPPVIHRDLTARNILISDKCQAKIADLGVAKIVDLQEQLHKHHTQVPGHMFYMPPEALTKEAACTPKLDIFSFGHLALHVAIQNTPEVYFIAPSDGDYYNLWKQGTMEIGKRRHSFDVMGRHHRLYPMIAQCLLDNPEKRPTSRDLNMELSTLSSSIEPCTLKRMSDILALSAGEDECNRPKCKEVEKELIEMTRKVDYLLDEERELIMRVEDKEREKQMIVEDVEREKQMIVAALDTQVSGLEEKLRWKERRLEEAIQKQELCAGELRELGKDNVELFANLKAERSQVMKLHEQTLHMSAEIDHLTEALREKERDISNLHVQLESFQEVAESSAKKDREIAMLKKQLKEADEYTTYYSTRKDREIAMLKKQLKEAKDQVLATSKLTLATQSTHDEDHSDDDIVVRNNLEDKGICSKHDSKIMTIDNLKITHSRVADPTSHPVPPRDSKSRSASDVHEAAILHDLPSQWQQQQSSQKHVPSKMSHSGSVGQFSPSPPCRFIQLEELQDVEMIRSPEDGPRQLPSSQEHTSPHIARARSTDTESQRILGLQQTPRSPDIRPLQMPGSPLQIPDTGPQPIPRSPDTGPQQLSRSPDTGPQQAPRSPDTGPQQPPTSLDTGSRQPPKSTVTVPSQPSNRGPQQPPQSPTEPQQPPRSLDTGPQQTPRKPRIRPRQTTIDQDMEQKKPISQSPPKTRPEQTLDMKQNSKAESPDTRQTPHIEQRNPVATATQMAQNFAQDLEGVLSQRPPVLPEGKFNTIAGGRYRSRARTVSKPPIDKLFTTSDQVNRPSQTVGASQDSSKRTPRTRSASLSGSRPQETDKAASAAKATEEDGPTDSKSVCHKCGQYIENLRKFWQHVDKCKGN